MLLHDKLLWHRLLHFSWALKHLHFKLLHFFWKAAQLHLKNPCPPDVVHFRASRSEICLSLLMSLSFSNCWGQRVQSARVYLLELELLELSTVAMVKRSFSFLSMMTPRCCEGSPPPVHHRNWQSNNVPYVASLQLKDHSFFLLNCAFDRSIWSVTHSLALFLSLSLRMLRRRSPSGEGLSGSGRETGSWSSDRGGDTSFTESSNHLQTVESRV